MKLKSPKILFFVAGYAPSAADQVLALDLGGSVQFRNATKINAEDPCEPCDGVAGDVPAQYAEKFPDAVDVIEEYRAALTAARDRMGDTAAQREPVRVKGPAAGKPAPGKTAAAKAAAATAKPAWGGKPATGAPAAAPAAESGTGEGGNGEGGAGAGNGDGGNTSE